MEKPGFLERAGKKAKKVFENTARATVLAASLGVAGNVAVAPNVEASQAEIATAQANLDLIKFKLKKAKDNKQSQSIIDELELQVQIAEGHLKIAKGIHKDEKASQPNYGFDSRNVTGPSYGRPDNSGYSSRHAYEKREQEIAAADREIAKRRAEIENKGKAQPRPSPSPEGSQK